MREKKWVPNIYQPDDEAAIVKRLEKLAAKGWFLDRAETWGWTLRRGKPSQVRYAVTYFPGASVFDPGPTEDQETYANYCRAAGWEFVSSYGPVQYFRSDLPDPVPIETDQGEKLAAIERLAEKYAPEESPQSRRNAIDREWAPLCMLEMSIDHLTGKEAIELVREKEQKN